VQEISQSVAEQQPVVAIPEINFFKASDFPQPPEINEFLKERMSNPFNKYCIDCKKN